MKSMKSLLVALAQSAIWPSYLLLLSYVARLGPWPRGLSRPIAFILAVTAGALLVSNFLRRIFGAKGWASQAFDVPPHVVRQLRRGRSFVLMMAGALVLPSQLLGQGLLAPAGQPLYAHTIERMLILAFELAFLWACHRIVRERGSLATWIDGPSDPLPRLRKHRGKLSWMMLGGIATLIALDTQGYGFTARRLTLALVLTFVVAIVCWRLERALLKLVDKNAWRWVKTGSGMTTPNHGAGALDQSEAGAKDISSHVRHLIHYGIPVLGLLLTAWVWEFDLALFRYVTEQKLWSLPSNDKGGPEAVAVGDFIKAILVFTATGVLWRNLSTIFAILVYPRMPDDPGVRFAVLTLCRYCVLGLGVMLGLTAISLGFDKIGMVLAALGVGLGFGLQEIVSNFVSGLILLLERPLRVGDIVTVANMTGKVDQINIRATTIINADNQSMIIPNREFITGNLINWTHKDNIVRISIKIGVAYGSDPDRVSDMLLAIAREDPDILGNPVASAQLEDFTPGALMFTLHAYVPDPSVSGRAKHRISTQIQRKFASAGIEIPLPTQELRFQASDFELMLTSLNSAPSSLARHQATEAAATPHIRIDRPQHSMIEA